MKVFSIFFMLILLILSACNNDNNLMTQRFIDASMLDGEWYMKSTLVDKQSHNSIAFTGMECGVERVVFEITQDKLLAFRSYHRENIDLPYNKKQSLVAAFPIIRQSKSALLSYLPSPKENFIEVDWSKNLAPHTECNGWLQSISQINLDVDSSDSAEIFRFRKGVDYIETTLNALVIPQEKACSSVGDPSCVAARYRVKFSFRKVPKSDYEKLNYPDYEYLIYGTNEKGHCLKGDEGCTDFKQLWLYSDAQKNQVLCDPLKNNISECFSPRLKMNARFGFFRTPVYKISERDGLSSAQERQLINRRNMWSKSKDENGNLIPLAQRIPRKIIYYLNPSFPEELYPAVKKVALEWNRAFANVVAKVRGKCQKESVIETKNMYHLDEFLKSKGIGSIEDNNVTAACALLYEKTKHRILDEIFFSGRPEEVSEIFGDIFEIRINDCNVDNVIRYQEENNLHNILTDKGLNILNQDTVEQACAILENESQKRGLDPFVWQQIGDLRFSFINAVAKPQEIGLLGYGPLAVDPKTGEIISGTANIYLSSIAQYATDSALLMEKMQRLEFASRMSKKLKGQPNPHSPNLNEIFERVKDFWDSDVYTYSSSLKENLIKILPQINFDQTLDLQDLLQSDQKDDIETLISLITQDKNLVIDDKKRADIDLKYDFYSERNACFIQKALHVPFEQLQKDLSKISLREKIEFLKQHITQGVLLHEIGHTLGLRHNFKGAQDALNFPPDFWGVKSESFPSRTEFVKNELRSSSIMEYHKYFNSDFFGLGLYDFAALAFGYGEKVEVFDESEYKFVPHSLMSKLGQMRYQDFPKLFSGNNAESKINKHINEVLNQYRQGQSSAFMDIQKLGLKDNAQNIYKRKYIDYEQLRRHVFNKYFSAVKNDIAEVPYAFCTDSQVGSDDLFCSPFLYGASSDEVVSDVINNYERSLFMKKLNLNHVSQQPSVYLNRIYKKVYQPFLKAYQKMFTYRNSEMAIYPVMHELALSTKQGLDLISRILQSVEPGIYCQDKRGDYIPKSQAKTCNKYISITGEQGQFFKSILSEDISGEVESLGFIYDKILALMALVDAQQLKKNDMNLSEGYSGAALYYAFKEQIIKIFSDLYIDNWRDNAPFVHEDASGMVKIEYQDLFSSKKNNLKRSAKIKPATSSILKDYAILLSMAGLSSLEDYRLDFGARSRIRELNAPAQPRIDSAIESIVFKNPHNGVSYQAFASDQKNISIGYNLLKNAADFISDGGSAQVPGDWYIAQTKMNQLFEKLNKNSLVNLSVPDEEKLKAELKAAQDEFEEQDKILHEKLRVIKQVQKLGEKLGLE
ncbi:MAG: zinc-dependent metalloprotease [Myxococcales bacterium]|nr:zinc-dependent metalloprotease [Myxococcales bacterium]USN51582.1 MAG: zinc-dependent metalloprotease [Myxococcales bacterium]